MTILDTAYRNHAITVCLLALLALMLVSSGCTQTASPQQQTPPLVTVTQQDNSHMTIAYPGSTDTSTLLELEVTVTDSAGKTQTRSVGDRYSTTPLKFGATLPITGTFNGNDHVVVTGYFMDSSHTLMLDTIL